MSTDASAPTLPLAPDDYLDHLQADLAAMAAVPADRLDADVVACPGWTVADLLFHHGAVLEFVTANLRAEPGGQFTRYDGSVPQGEDPLAYFSARAEGLIDALEATDPDEHRPNWAGAETSAFWWRRMTQEALIHRFDAENAVGEAAEIDPLMAIDGLDELCDVFLARTGFRRGLPTGGETVHLHATDAGAGETLPAGEWMLTFGADGVVVETTHGKGDFAFRGPAADLLLFSWNRSPAAVDAFGDGDPKQWWREHVRV